MKTKIKIYSTSNCPFCLRAKNYFTQNNFEFEEVDLTNKYSELDNLKNITGHMTVPQIFINDQFIGGYSELMQKINSGELVLQN